MIPEHPLDLEKDVLGKILARNRVNTIYCDCSRGATDSIELANTLNQIGEARQRS